MRSIVVEPHIWLAGNPGSPPSAAAVAFLLASLALAFAVSAGVAWSRRRREEPLRKEIRSRPMVTFRSSVDVKANFLGTMTSQRGPLYLTVHGDVFEVSHPFSLARFLFGQDYCYRAEATAIKVVPGLLHDWIEISGLSGMRAAYIQIGRRKMNRQIWDALERSGAQPIGPPPLDWKY
jgi:hypothetical protein